MRRMLMSVSLVAVIAATTVGCGGARDVGDASASGATASPAVEPVTYPVDLVDGAGQEHTFTEPTTKIACMATGCVEALADMGIAPYAAWSFIKNGPMNYPNGEPEVLIEDGDVEEWANSGADVFVQLPYPDAIKGAKPLEKIGDVVYLHPAFEQWAPSADLVVEGAEAFKMDLRMLGEITGEPEAAADAIGRYDGLLSTLQEHAPEGAADMVFANLFHTDDGTYNMLDPGSNFCDVLTEYSLGNCVQMEGWDSDSWEVNAEAFLASDPDWIGYTQYGQKVSFADRDDPVWGRLTAVKNGNVFDFSEKTYCCSLRAQAHALIDYAANVWGVEGGIEDPGPEASFDPAQNPLLNP